MTGNNSIGSGGGGYSFGPSKRVDGNGTTSLNSVAHSKAKPPKGNNRLSNTNYILDIKGLEFREQ